MAYITLPLVSCIFYIWYILGRLLSFGYTKYSMCSTFFQLFINNEYVNSVAGDTFETFNPATGKKLADVQEGKQVR